MPAKLRPKGRENYKGKNALKLWSIMQVWTHTKGVLFLENLFFFVFFIFLPTSPQSKLQDILQATFTHSKNLALFVTLYKSLTSILASLESKSQQYHSLLSAFIGGYLIFGTYNKVNEQVMKHFTIFSIHIYVYLPAIVHRLSFNLS